MSVTTEGPAAPSDFEASDRQLRKTMTLTQLVFLSLGGIIGSGWLFAALASAAVAGPAAIVSWIVGGVLVIFVALNYAEVSGMLPRSGAIVRYPHLTHGGYTGFLIGWAYLLSAVSVPAIEAEAVVTYMAGKFPSLGLTDKPPNTSILSWPNGILLGVGLMLLFFVVNYFGIRFLSEFNRWIVWWKLVIPTATFILLFFAFKGANFHSYGGFAPLGKAPIFQAIATTGIIFSYLGFRQAVDFGGEARNPQRDVPIATILSVVIGIVMYTVLQVAFVGALEWHKFGLHPGAWASLSSNAKLANGPLYNELKATGIAALGSFATVLLIDAAVSPAGTGWVYIGTASRTFYGLSIMRYFPRSFQSMNRFRIPWLSLGASLVVGCLFFIPLPSWYSLVGFISSATVLTYIMGGVGVAVMRKHAPDMPRPFRMPAAPVLAPVGYVAAVMIVYWSGFAILTNVFAAVFVGLSLFVWIYAPDEGWFSRQVGAAMGAVFLVAWVFVNYEGGWVLRSAPPAKGAWSFSLYGPVFAALVVLFSVAVWAVSSPKGRHQVARTSWFIFLVLATFALSYFGEYGPLKAKPIPFPWSDLIEVGIGLVTYYWAVASGFQTEEMRAVLRAPLGAGQGAVGLAPAPGE